MDAWIEQLRGRFVVFDGPDGSGKSSQFRLFADHVAERGVRVCEVREPGGTGIGEQIRDVLLNPDNDEMDVRAEMLLYMASRAQLVTERIVPALAAGQLVLADRFVSSTLAYQGTAGGVPYDDIAEVARIVCAHATPDLIVIFDVDQETAAHRLNPLLDRMEAKGAEFHARVRAGYLKQAESNPDAHLVINAIHDVPTVFQSLLSGVAERLGGSR